MNRALDLPDTPASQTMSMRLRIVLLIAVVAMAMWLRLRDLGDRPMHADEANQAVKTGQLLETGGYVFDPSDHHGPTLYYFAVLPAILAGQMTLAELTEPTLRITPALFGSVAVLLLYVLAAPLGRGAALGAAALMAVSPPAVYYSRYFVQETLLVTFTLAALVCAQQWWKSEGKWGAVGAGIFVGLMVATKSTAPVFLIAALAAVLISGCGRRLLNLALDRHTLVSAGLAALLVWVAFYSSFGTNWVGLRDAFTTYSPMFHKAVGGETGHERPWWYYGSLFLFQKRGGYVWDQTLFLLLALVGGVIAFRRTSKFGRFAVGYAGIVAVLLSIVPYKTPWLVINLVPGFCLLAGAAIAAWRPVIAVPLAVVVLSLLGSQTGQTVFQRPADPRNPYAYVHTSPDMLKVPAVAANVPAGPVKVISEEYWPLPWYLRKRPQVGYWVEPPEDCDGSLVIASASKADAVRSRLRGSYVESYLGLRPGFIVVVFTPANR